MLPLLRFTRRRRRHIARIERQHEAIEFAIGDKLAIHRLQAGDALLQVRRTRLFRLRDGEIISGVIEWYDKDCLKVNREGDPNLLLFKANIKYMYKAQ